MKHSCVATPNPRTRARCPRRKSATGRGGEAAAAERARRQLVGEQPPGERHGEDGAEHAADRGDEPEQSGDDSDHHAAQEQPDPVPDRSPEAVPDVGLPIAQVALDGLPDPVVDGSPTVSVRAVNETATSTSAAPTIAVPSVTRITVAQTPHPSAKGVIATVIDGRETPAPRARRGTAAPRWRRGSARGP